MRKVQVLAPLCTLALAIPFTALALIGVAAITENLGRIAAGLTSLTQIGWQAVGVEAWSRWPEVAGMALGQLLILSLLLIALRRRPDQEAA